MSKLAVVTDARLDARPDLEGLIYDVVRAAELARRLVVDEGNLDEPEELDLATFAVTQCHKLATELREAFYKAPQQ